MPMAERFKRLYLSKETAQPMRWSMEGKRKHDDDIMMHPRDGEAWHALDRFDPKSSDPRSIRFGLATHGFTPFSIGAAPYSVGPFSSCHTICLLICA